MIIEERYFNALKVVEKRVKDPKTKRIIELALDPNSVCSFCKGTKEVKNPGRWCVFEEEGPMTIFCLKIKAYIQNSNKCDNCSYYEAKCPKIECSACC